LKVTNTELLQEFARLRPQHASNAATRRALALRFDLSENAVRWRLRRALKRESVVAKFASTAPPSNVIPLPLRKEPRDIPLDAIPDGHHVKGVSTLIDGDGIIRGQWIKTSREQQQWQHVVNAVLERIPELIHPLPPILSTVAPANDLLALYPLADLHIGLYAAASDGEADWRLADAVTLVKGCIDDLIMRTPPASHAVVAQMGDFMHIDNLSNRTPNSGAALDADGRLIEIAQAAMELAVHIISRVASHHERVTVVWQSGNHDEASALVMQSALALLYRDNDRIHVHQSGKRTHVLQHEQVALGFTHGDTIKPRQLPLIMATDFPEIWAATRYRVWHTGHRHHKEAEEFIGCTVETHQSPAPRDGWHERSGYRSGHSMVSVVYDAVGEYARQTVQVRRRAEVQPAARELRNVA
jgi:hypothetical protein